MSLKTQRCLVATFGAMLLHAGCSTVQEPVAPGAYAYGAVVPVMFSRTQEPAVFMEALFTGRVVADGEGCIRLDSPDRHTVVWPRGFRVAPRGQSWVVLDAAGAEVGSIGASFRLGGGEVTQLPADMLTAADREKAATRCPGRYWLAWIPSP